MTRTFDLHPDQSPDRAARKIARVVEAEGSVLVVARGPKQRRLVRKLPQRLPDDWIVRLTTNEEVANDDSTDATLAFHLLVRRPDVEQGVISYWEDAAHPRI